MRFAKIYEYARFESLLYVGHIRLLQEEYQPMFQISHRISSVYIAIYYEVIEKLWDDNKDFIYTRPFKNTEVPLLSK